MNSTPFYWHVFHISVVCLRLHRGVTFSALHTIRTGSNCTGHKTWWRQLLWHLMIPRASLWARRVVNFISSSLSVGISSFFLFFARPADRHEKSLSHLAAFSPSFSLQFFSSVPFHTSPPIFSLFALFHLHFPFYLCSIHHNPLSFTLFSISLFTLF